MSEVMLDIETLSTRTNAVIMTIGAIKFSRKNDLKELKNLETFYVRIKKKSCEKLAMHTDDDTIKWWNTQTKEARYEIFENKDRIKIKEALIKLSEFVKDHRYIWAHSPNFDCVILENAYRQCELEIPWKFYNLRDTRTIYDIGKVTLKDFSIDIESHNALHDCYVQIKALRQALKNIKYI